MQKLLPNLFGKVPEDSFIHSLYSIAMLYFFVIISR